MCRVLKVCSLRRVCVAVAVTEKKFSFQDCFFKFSIITNVDNSAEISMNREKVLDFAQPLQD